MKILSVVGARPNFMKIAPFIKEIKEYNAKKKNFGSKQIRHFLVHVGQHYDFQMSRLFFHQLGISKPDINLGIGSGTHAEQVGKTMIAFEKVVKKYKPDWIVIVGDVNATLACSITAKKENINCCHIEAGVRSGDLTMPEEVNRLVADRLSDLLLTPDRFASQNLKKEGISNGKICFVGNIMIDSIESNREKAKSLSLRKIVLRNQIKTGFNFLKRKKIAVSFQDENKSYGVLTLHRPANVEQYDVLSCLVEFMVNEVARDFQIIWPLHPRTINQLKVFNLWRGINNCRNLFLTKPLGYLEMLRLNMGAKVVFTDSGGLQGECNVLGVPCLVVRQNTEWPITLKKYGGNNILVGDSIVLLRELYKKVLSEQNISRRPELWDGNSAKRCLQAIINYQ
ncbi:MAG: UDP-N-acetylglucosamine 2-epimerase (non-hydrolyzing) [Candidatus Omnitrophica bacterium]|nr:UDP-N-acetylglucosamine 2-epimerase (non-hydrolyzing) [Candidatus Omnitrophota bacterium]